MGDTAAVEAGSACGGAASASGLSELLSSYLPLWGLDYKRYSLNDSLAGTDTFKTVRGGISNEGNPSRINIIRTLRSAHAQVAAELEQHACFVIIGDLKAAGVLDPLSRPSLTLSRSRRLWRLACSLPVAFSRARLASQRAR